MTENREIFRLLQLVRKERQTLAEKRRLSKYVATLRSENQRLLIEIGHCRNNVDNLRKMIVTQDDDPHKDYLHYIHQRERMLHQRNRLKERRADQRRKVDELDKRFERLQLSTFPVFS